MTTRIDQIRTDEDRYQARTYSKIPISIESGEGCYVYDSDGNKYLDLYGGHAVVSTGHCHPCLVEAIQKQVAELIFYSNVTYNSVRSRAVRKLVEIAGSPYHQAFLVNSGSEANDNALKLARAVTGRAEIISLTGSFHGRTYGSLSSTGISKYSAYLNTPVPMHRILPVHEVAAAISQKTAGVLLEPIQSLGGVREITLEILTEIDGACRKQGALLIFDEVQTGVGRTGSFLYAGRGGVYPPLVTLAKGIASGFPASAVLMTKAVADHVHSGDLGATFGGGPLACAAIEATLDVISSENLCRNSFNMGRYLRKRLTDLEIGDILGQGLLVGIKMKDTEGAPKAKDMQQILLRKGILTGTSDDPYVLRLMPPLTITRKEIDLFLEALQV